TINPVGKFQITDDQLDIFTSQGLSNGWTKDGLTISANPDVNYSSLRINSNHSSVSDRGVLNVTRSSSSLFYVRTDGNIGIGTINPVGKFQITDDQLDIFTSQGLSNGWTKDGLTISANPDVNYSSLRINSNHSSVSDRGVLNVTRSSSSLFYVRTDGNVGIGTTTPDAKLTVNGTIHSKEVKVDLSVPGPDYVFEEDYPLTSLDEIESYIKQNKHLPEVPSAAEFEENGIKVGEMNMLLLKKLEEVTLHLIRQQEEIDSLKEQMKKQ
ncbi:MAG: tail fiber protein, partial [Cyclobacteriaceae bacterium]